MKKLFFLSLIFCFWGCDGNILPPTAGPCVHEYRGPIFNINNVTSESTGGEISEITLSEFLIDNLAGNLNYFEFSISDNITVQDSSVTCTVPCGFGTEAAKYQFKVSTQGYLDSTITTTTVYKDFGGGCPSFNDEGTKISFSLKPD